MSDLDDLSIIKRLDLQNVLGSIKKLPDQCRQAREEANKINFPLSYKNINNIVVSGMGGSSYGVRIVKSLYDGAKMTKIPIELSSGYWLPGYVNNKTLVILSSYSGKTEETLSCAGQAIKKKAKIIGITSGGQLAKLLTTSNYPSYIFNPIHNPSKQPRIGVGYMIIGLIAILAKLSLIPVGEEEIIELIDFLVEKNKIYVEDNPVSANPAKQLAQKLDNIIAVFIVADFLEGASYVIQNQFHETAKQFAVSFSIPQLNHHLLEGFNFPDKLQDTIRCVLVDSCIYDKRNRKRFELTKEIISQNKIDYETIELEGYSALTQTMELIQFSSWMTFYLAMLNNVDPAKIPYVDYFKKN